MAMIQEHKVGFIPHWRKGNYGEVWTRVTTPDGTSPTTMKNRILRVAAELGVPVTIRRVPGGLIFWRSTAEDLQQAQEIAARLQSARQPPPATLRGRRRRRP